jgi:hypothetical protein
MAVQLRDGCSSTVMLVQCIHGCSMAPRLGLPAPDEARAARDVIDGSTIGMDAIR